MTGDRAPQQTRSLAVPEPRARSIWYRWGRPGLGIFLSLAVMFWLVTALDFRQVLLALRQADYGWISLGLLAVIVTLWARVRRWHALLDSRQVKPGGTMQALVVGQLLNLIFPARIGDLGRVDWITRQGYPSRAQALGTVALEKLWDIILLTCLVLGLVIWQPQPDWFTVPARLTGAAGAIVLVSIVAVLYLRRRAPFSWSNFSDGSSHLPNPARWLRQVGDRLLDGLEGIRRPQLMVAAGSWSIVVWLFGALTNLAVLQAFHLPFSMGIALFLLAVLQLGVAIPSVPGRFGIFEGLCLLSLTMFGIEANLALAYGVVLHLVVLLPPLLLGLWWLLRHGLPAQQTVREVP